MTRGRVFLLSLAAGATMLIPAIAAAQSCPCGFTTNGPRTFKDNTLTCWGVLTGPNVPQGAAGVDAVKPAKNGSTDEWEFYVSEGTASTGAFCAVHHFKCRDGSCRESLRDQVYGDNLTPEEFNACADELETVSALAPHAPLALPAPGQTLVTISTDSCLAASTLLQTGLNDFAIAWGEAPEDYVAEDFFPESLRQSTQVVLAMAGITALPGMMLIGWRRRSRPTR